MTDEVFPFIYVRSDALDDPELLKSPATFLTLCTISLYAKRKKDGRCYFKQDTIAERLGKTRQAISLHLQTLERLGYIEIINQTFCGRQSNNEYKLLYDSPLKFAVQGELAAPQGDLAATVQGELAPKPVLTKPEEREKALTRQEFVLETSKGFHARSFGGEFGHLTESDIHHQSEECFERWGDTLKGRDACVMLRSWLRKGQSLGTVRKAPAEKKEGARRGSDEHERPRHLQQWASRVKGWQEKRFWMEHLWGLPPDDTRTSVPREILTEFNINQKEIA